MAHLRDRCSAHCQGEKNEASHGQLLSLAPADMPNVTKNRNASTILRMLPASGPGRGTPNSMLPGQSTAGPATARDRSGEPRRCSGWSRRAGERRNEGAWWTGGSETSAEAACARFRMIRIAVRSRSPIRARRIKQYFGAFAYLGISDRALVRGGRGGMAADPPDRPAASSLVAHLATMTSRSLCVNTQCEGGHHDCK